MTSTNSSNNFLAALKNNFRQHAALFAVFQIFALLLSILLVNFNADYFDGGNQLTNNITETFSNRCMPLFACICSIEAFILAAVLFRGIYSKRASDFYFSLPVKRGSWFNANFLFGVISMALSYAIFYIISMITVNFGSFKAFRFVNLEAGSFLKFTVMSFAAVAVLYTIFVMCAVIAGRIWQYVFLSFISTLVLYIGAIGFICYLNMIYGFWVNLEASYSVAAVYLAFGSIADFSVLKFAIAAVAQFAVFYTAGYFAFKKRKAEVAENRLSGKAFPMALTVICFLAEVFVCLGLSEEVSLGVRIFAAIIIVAVTAVVLSAIFFRKAMSKPVFASLFCAIMLSAATILSVQLISEKIYVNVVPETDEIETVSICDYNGSGSSNIADVLYGINYLNILFEDEDKKYEFLTDEAKEKAVELHKKVISDETRKNNYLSSYYENGTLTLRIEYKLKNGKRIKRIYEVATKCIADEGVALFKTDEGLNKLDVFDFAPDDVVFSVFRLGTDDYAEPFYIEDIDSQKLIDCVKKDIKNRETDTFLDSAVLPLLIMLKEYVPGLDNEPTEDVYIVSFYTFKKRVSESVRAEIEKLPPKEILKHKSDDDLQIDYYNNQWFEGYGTYIYKEDINTISYLEKLGYKF